MINKIGTIDCVYCNSPDIKARTIIQDDLAWAFPTNIPITHGHTLVCPIRHVEKFEELTVDEAKAVLDMRMRMRKALRDVFGAQGFHYVWNEGGVAGQTVPHLHLHIVPRKEGDSGITEYEPRKFLYRPGSREATPEEELRAVAKQLQESLM